MEASPAHSQIESAITEIRTYNAVVVLGAGASFEAGMPLAGQLPPLVWHTLDACSTCREAVADALGVAHGSGKTVVGDSWNSLIVAFAKIAEDTDARKVFQEAFSALDRERASRASVVHTALARLMHAGHVESVISLNWDCLLESSFKRLFGVGINDVQPQLWKPHGDASDPTKEWVLPNEPGKIDASLISAIQEKVSERPRVLLIVGYSERDAEVVSRLIGPLSDKWRVIRIGPSASGSDAIPLSAPMALQNLAELLCGPSSPEGWEHVTFFNQRGIGPAIAGERLGPSDVEACPRLPHIARLRTRLDTSHVATLTAQAGCGKSVTAYQVAYDYQQQGWEVLRAEDIAVDESRLLASAETTTRPTLLLVDDGQLYSDHLKKRLAELASPTRLVLIVSTDPDAKASESIHISNTAAVETLAVAFRIRRDEILPIVQKFDDHVGESSLDTSIERRIALAAAEKTPWQMNFVMRGGWRTVRHELATLRDIDRADLLLVLIAVRQIASLDEPVDFDLLCKDATFLTRDVAWLTKSLDLLRRRRLVTSQGALRCAHIEVARVVLSSYFKNCTDSQFEDVLKWMRSLLLDPTTQLRGISWLVHQLRITDGLRGDMARKLIDDSVWQHILVRCLGSDKGVHRRDACFALEAVASWIKTYKDVMAQRITICQWIEQADDASAYAIGNLINSLYNESHDDARSLVEQAETKKIAHQLALATPSNAYTWGFFLGRLGIATSEDWRKQLHSDFDKSKLFKLIQECPPDALSGLGQLIPNLYYRDETLGFACLDHALPTIAAAFDKAPLDTWNQIDEIPHHMLGYGFFRFEKPNEKQQAYAKKLVELIPVEKLAADFSVTRQADWEWYSRIIYWMREISVDKFEAFLRCVDIDKLDKMTTGLWKRPPRELRLLVSSLYSMDCREKVNALVGRHKDEIETLDPIVIKAVPTMACELIRNGTKVDLFGHSGHDWHDAGTAVARIWSQDQELAVTVVTGHVDAIATRISDLHSIDCGEGEDDELSVFMALLRELSPKLLSDILARVDADSALKTWSKLLGHEDYRKRCASTLRTLVNLAIEHGGTLESVGHEMRRKFPELTNESKD